MEDVDDLLHSIYYNPKDSGSFGSVESLFKRARLFSSRVTRKIVRKWLSGELAYTLHKQARRRFQRNPILVSSIDEQWQADLVDLQEFSRQNNGNKYLLTVIDCFSKYAWVIPLQNKSAQSVKDAFHKIFKERRPSKLQTDQGREFQNRMLRKLLDDNGIQFFTSNNRTVKCSIIERFNRTLKTKMFKYFTANGTRRYVDILYDLVKTYNHTKHRVIKIRPVDASADTSPQIFQNLYGFESKRAYLMHRKDTGDLKARDLVRKKYQLGPFDKGYYPSWSDPIYTVKNVTADVKKPFYQINDEEGHPINSRFYSEELQGVTPRLHRIEKILRRRKRNGRIQYLVKWLNHPPALNSWIDSNDLTRIH